jgi:hypothetical protein
MRNGRSDEFEGKAAEDSRTPKPREREGLRESAPGSWSAAVFCGFVDGSVQTENCDHGIV